MPERVAEPDPPRQLDPGRVGGQECLRARLRVPARERSGTQLAAGPVGLVHDGDPGLAAQPVAQPQRGRQPGDAATHHDDVSTAHADPSLRSAPS
jgi:hypothetical protein